MNYVLCACAIIGILAMVLLQPACAAEAQRGYTSEAYKALSPGEKDEYDKLMNLGDSASKNKDYLAARDYYGMANGVAPGDYNSLGAMAQARLLGLETASDLGRSKEKDARELAQVQADLAKAKDLLQSNHPKGDFQYWDTLANIKTVSAEAYRVGGDYGEAAQAEEEARQDREAAESALSKESSFGLLPLDPVIVIAGIAIAGIGLAVRKRRA